MRVAQLLETDSGQTTLSGLVSVLLKKGKAVMLSLPGYYGDIIGVRGDIIRFRDRILGGITEWSAPADADERFTLKDLDGSFAVVEVDSAVPYPFTESAPEPVTDLRGNPKPMIYRGIEHVAAQGGRVTSKIPGAVGEWTIRPKRSAAKSATQSFDIQVNFSDGSSTWFEVIPEDDDALTMKKVKAGLWRVFTLPGQEFKL